MIDVIALAVIVMVTVILVIFQITKKYDLFNLGLIRLRNDCIFTYTLISTISMIYIQRKSAKLKELGIGQSYVIMTCYVSLLVLISIVVAISTRIFMEMQDVYDET